jgi:hypothetical protein
MLSFLTAMRQQGTTQSDSGSGAPNPVPKMTETVTPREYGAGAKDRVETTNDVDSQGNERTIIRRVTAILDASGNGNTLEVPNPNRVVVTKKPDGTQPVETQREVPASSHLLMGSWIKDPQKLQVSTSPTGTVFQPTQTSRTLTGQTHDTPSGPALVHKPWTNQYVLQGKPLMPGGHLSTTPTSVTPGENKLLDAVRKVAGKP